MNQQGFYKFIYFVMNFTEGILRWTFYNAFLTNRRSDCLATLSEKFKMAGICNCWWFWCLALGTCFSATFPLLTIYVLILHAFYKRSVVVTNVYCGGRHAASFNARLWSWLEKLGTISLLSALFTFPFANWLNAQLMPL